MSVPTTEQIEKEIKKLTEMKPKVRPFSMFGDDNRAKIDAQIQVLEERMDEDDVWAEFDPEDEGMDNPILESARYAVEWLEGDMEEPLSKGWEGLVQ